MSERRHDLDWIRVGAFFLLILYHVGMFYVPWDWHAKSPQPVAWLEPVMRLSSPWRLSLLFVVSGAATRFMADKVAAGVLARQRAARLLPPLLLGVFVVVPPQTWVEVGWQGSVAGFYAHYLANGWPGIVTPTYNHLWFVFYLFVYTLIVAFVRPRLRLDWMRGWMLLALPAAVLFVLRQTLYPAFGVTHAFVDDWYNHAVSLGMFVFGYSIAKSEVLREEFIHLRWTALVLAVGGYALSAYPVQQWCAVAAALGFGAKHLNRGGPVLEYLTLAVFPFYIVHQTIIVLAAPQLVKLGLHQGLEAAILILATFAGCFIIYEAVRRIGWLRPWFGLKPQWATRGRML